MSIRPDNLPFRQDMPPPGGFKTVDISRNLPARGPKGWQIWLGSIVFITYGFYTIAKTNDERNRQKLEDRRVRYAMSVLLKTESDREYMRREEIYLEQEREIMKDVKGWRVGESPYYSNKFAKRAVDPLKHSS